MPRYHVYGVDETGGIIGERWLTAGCDEEAITIVNDLKREYECQIWKFDFRVAKVPAWTPKGPD